MFLTAPFHNYDDVLSPTSALPHYPQFLKPVCWYGFGYSSPVSVSEDHGTNSRLKTIYYEQNYIQKMWMQFSHAFIFYIVFPDTICTVLGWAVVMHFIPEAENVFICASL